MTKKKIKTHKTKPATPGQLTRAQITALYRHAIVDLDEIDKAQAAGDDQLEACLAALLIVKRLIEAEPSAAGVARSLNVLSKTLQDILSGSKPHLLYNRRRRKGHPKNPSSDAIKGVAAACHALLEKKAGKAEAAAIIARGLSDRGIRMPHAAKEPQEITATQIKRWHYEIDGYPDLKAARIRDQVLAGLRAKPSNSQAPDELVQKILDALEAKGF